VSAAAGGPSDASTLGICNKGALAVVYPEAMFCNKCAAPCRPGDAGESKTDPNGGGCRKVQAGEEYVATAELCALYAGMGAGDIMVMAGVKS
jgi:hypothetical protein